MSGVGVEEYILVRAGLPFDSAEDRYRRRAVTVADVILRTASAPSSLSFGREDHVGLIDVGAVRLLGESERAYSAGLESGGCPLPSRSVFALPNRAEPKDRDLVRVPVIEAVETGNLRQCGDACGVPAFCRVAISVLRGCQERGKHLFLRQELQELGVIAFGVEVLQ